MSYTSALTRVRNVLGSLEMGTIQCNEAVFTSVLHSCGKLSLLPELKKVHEHIAKNWILHPNTRHSLGTHLVQAYLACGNLVDAKRTFDSLSNQGVSLWASLVTAYAQKGHYSEALHTLELMQKNNVQPDRVTFVAALSGFRGLGALPKMKEIHEKIVKTGLHEDLIVCNALINAYAKCCSLEDSWKVFRQMPVRDVVSWTSMLAACGKKGHVDEAVLLFRKMQLQGVRPNRITLLEMMSSCCSSLAEASTLHSLVLECGLQLEMANALVNIYAKCGDLPRARSIFDGLPRRDVVAYTSMISAYVNHANPIEALKLFTTMQQDHQGHLDHVLFLAVLSACSEPSDVRMVHSYVGKSGLIKNLNVLNALIHTYGKYGCLAEAYRVFTEMEERDAFSWTSILAGFLQRGRFHRAFYLFREMQLHGYVPNEVTVITLINACAAAGVAQGRVLQWYAEERGMVTSSTVVATALVDMHGKLGSLDDACAVFGGIVKKDVVSWTAMVASYAQNGHGAQAGTTFQRMQQEGEKPGDIAFVSMVSACAHAGLVDHGCDFLATMVKDHCLSLKVRHFGAAVDLFGRAGRLEEAEYVVASMPFKPQPPHVLMAFLSACKMHGDAERRRKAAAFILRDDSTIAAAMVAQFRTLGDAGTPSTELRELVAEGCWSASADMGGLG